MDSMIVDTCEANVDGDISTAITQKIESIRKRNNIKLALIVVYTLIIEVIICICCKIAINRFGINGIQLAAIVPIIAFGFMFHHRKDMTVVASRNEFTLSGVEHTKDDSSKTDEDMIVLHFKCEDRDTEEKLRVKDEEKLVYYNKIKVNGM